MGLYKLEMREKEYKYKAPGLLFYNDGDGGEEEYDQAIKKGNAIFKNTALGQFDNWEPSVIKINDNRRQKARR